MVCKYAGKKKNYQLSLGKCGETAMYNDNDGDIAALRFCIPCLENRKNDVMNMLQRVGYEQD